MYNVYPCFSLKTLGKKKYAFYMAKYGTFYFIPPKFAKQLRYNEPDEYILEHCMSKQYILR